jgi:hypothetical protein
MCMSCGAGKTCTNGQCVNLPTCTTSNCSTGCCNGTTCVQQAQQSNSQCGNGGNACNPCIGSSVCAGGACQPPATLGGTCTTNANCASLGTGATCKLQTSGGYPYSGGFCTLPCTTPQTSCGTNGTCIGGGVFPSFSESDIVCSPNCAIAGTQSTCRSGYFCYDDGSGSGQCWLDPLPPFDGGGICNKIGNACTSDSQCISPPGADWGFCISGDAGRFNNGYCTADCSFDNTNQFCGSNGLCAGFLPSDGGANPDFYLCLERCPNPGAGRGSLRTGYTCYTITDIDGGTAGYAWPSCDRPGQPACPSGFSCNTTNGYCCQGTLCYR